jgi:hypothetical protein
MKKNELIIEVCIPHRMPAKAYIYADRDEFKDAMLECARQSDNYHCYHEHLIFGGDEAIAYALSGPEGHQKLRARRLVRELLMAELDKTEWPKKWQIDAIMDEMADTEELEEGEAMYYDKATGEIEIGQDGCQNAGAVCLRVGPDNVGNLDMQEIRSALEEQIGGAE